MSLLTTIYKFIKPELTDSPPDITAMNPNWDAIDAELNSHETQINSLAAVDSCTVYSQLNQSVASGVDTVLIYDSDEFDTNDMHDIATNNERITIKKAGKYLVIATVIFASNNAYSRSVNILKNGGMIRGGMVTTNAVSSAETRIKGMLIVDCVAGDYITVAVFQDSGTALDVKNEGGFNGSKLQVIELK